MLQPALASLPGTPEPIAGLRVVARQARRRVRDSEAPLPPWLVDWLQRADALCEAWLGGPTPAVQAVASTAATA